MPPERSVILSEAKNLRLFLPRVLTKMFAPILASSLFVRLGWDRA
jgi:hypothetical protein